jgi:hypothetical protein
MEVLGCTQDNKRDKCTRQVRHDKDTTTIRPDGPTKRKRNEKNKKSKEEKRLVFFSTVSLSFVGIKVSVRARVRE